jgi:zinc protease
MQGDSFEPSGGFMAYAIFAPQNADKLEKAFNEEIARVLNEDFSAKELEEAKSGYLQGKAVSRSQDGELAGALSHSLFLGRTLKWDADFEAKIAALTAADIRAAFQKHLLPAKFTVIKAGDFKKAATPPTAK